MCLPFTVGMCRPGSIRQLPTVGSIPPRRGILGKLGCREAASSSSTLEDKGDQTSKTRSGFSKCGLYLERRSRPGSSFLVSCCSWLRGGAWERDFAQTQETLVTARMVCDLISVYLSCYLSRPTGHVCSNLHPVSSRVSCMYRVCTCVVPCTYVLCACMHVCGEENRRKGPLKASSIFLGPQVR